MAEVAAGVLAAPPRRRPIPRNPRLRRNLAGLTVRARDALGGETGLRPAFLGHLLVELLLDAALIADNQARLTEYYRVLDELDAPRVEAAVNRMAPRPTGAAGDLC